jgi:biofilm protein TabA
MILDSLSQAERYFGLHPLFAGAFEFLRTAKNADLDLGRHEIDGSRMFALVACDSGRSKADVPLEAHRKYIDIQLSLADGGEQMGWRPTADCHQVTQPYDESRDIAFYADPPHNWVLVGKNQFAIFFPVDAHAPLVGDGPLPKIIVKVAV